MRTTTAIALAALLTSNATAQVVEDGNVLLKTCKSDSPAYGYCIGYLRGIVARSSLQRAYYCVPEPNRDDLMAAAVVVYLEQDKSQLHYPAVMLAMNALERAYGCATNQGAK